MYDETKHLCADPLFLNIFNKDGYVTPRRMYANSYDNYSTKGSIFQNTLLDLFALEYKSKLKWGNPKSNLIPSKQSDETKKGIQNLELEDFPSNFSEDLEEVYTSDYFVYSDGRGFIPNATPYNVFRLVYHADQSNTWGGEGSVKVNAENGKLDTVGLVPMGQNLIETSKNLNRRVRW